MNQTNKRRGNGEGRRDPAAIQREIQHTRGELDRTLEEIESRLSPGELLHEIWSHLSGREGEGEARMSDTVSKIATKIADNPVPVALIGIGTVALLKSSGSTTEDVREPGEGAGSRASGVAAKARDRMSGAASAMRERASSTASRARESMSSSYGKVRHEIEDNPVLLGALGFALGAALGAGMPRTRFEDEHLGKHRDEMMARASEMGREVASSAKRAMSDVSESVEEPARRE